MIRFLPVGETPVGVSGPAEDAWVLRAAVGLQEARAERSAARDVLARTAPPWYHLRSARAHRRAETAAARSFIRANAEIQQHERSLEYHGAGADPDEWGVFSLAPGITLGRDPDDELDHVIDANERGLKDTVRVNPHEIVEIAVRFHAYSGRYMYHCHILEHEDRDMMRPFVTMPPELMPFMA